MLLRHPLLIFRSARQQSGLLIAPSLSLACSLLPGLLQVSGVHAQPVPDNSLAPNNTLVSPGPSFTVTGGTQLGSSLYHSFDSFSIPTGTTVEFSHDVTVDEIFARVTGTSESTLDGTLSTSGNAAVFFLNPNGITFGSNAQLQLGGTTVFSTADNILTTSGTPFSTGNQTSPDPLLAVSIPVGLQFGANAGAINFNQSNLAGAPGQSVVFAGNGIVLDGANISSSNDGRITLLSVGENSRVNWNFQPNSPIGFQNGTDFRSINFNNGSRIRTNDPLQSSGDITLEGRIIRLDSGSQLQANGEGSGNGGSILINATSLVQLEDSSGGNGSRISVAAQPGANAAAGQIRINTPNLRIEDGSTITAATQASSNAGSISIDANTIFLSGTNPNGNQRSNISASALTGSSGQGGTVSLRGGRLQVLDGASINVETQGTGSGGTLTVNVQDVILDGKGSNQSLQSGLISQANPGSNGDGGNISLIVDTLTIDRGAGIHTGNLGTGSGGTLSVEAQQSITIGANTPDGDPGGIIQSRADTNLPNAGTTIDLETTNLVLENGGQILSSNAGTGPGGDIQIQASQMTINNGRIITSATGDGPAGNIIINSDTAAFTQGEITTRTASGNGGNLDLILVNSLSLSDSTLIRAEGLSGGLANATGSNLVLQAPILNASNNSDIIVSAASGTGGNVQIDVPIASGIEFRNVRTANSDILASGTVTVTNFPTPIPPPEPTDPIPPDPNPSDPEPPTTEPLPPESPTTEIPTSEQPVPEPPAPAPVSPSNNPSTPSPLAAPVPRTPANPDPVSNLPGSSQPNSPAPPSLTAIADNLANSRFAPVLNESAASQREQKTLSITGFIGRPEALAAEFTPRCEATPRTARAKHRSRHFPEGTQLQEQEDEALESRFVISGRGGLPVSPQAQLQKMSLWRDGRGNTMAPLTKRPLSKTATTIVEASGLRQESEGKIRLVAARAISSPSRC